MSQQVIVTYWMEKALQDIESAWENFRAKRYENAVRDTYFACFHAISSLLFKEGRTFRTHKEVRSSLHRDYIRTNRLPVKWGKHYDWLFENRQKADYRPLVKFDPDQVEQIIEESKSFVQEIRLLVSK